MRLPQPMRRGRLVSRYKRFFADVALDGGEMVTAHCPNPGAMLGLALVSWLTVRWCDAPDGKRSDRILVLIAYLSGLGYANHMAGFLALPAVAVAVLRFQSSS